MPLSTSDPSAPNDPRFLGRPVPSDIWIFFALPCRSARSNCHQRRLFGAGPETTTVNLCSAKPLGLLAVSTKVVVLWGVTTIVLPVTGMPLIARSLGLAPSVPKESVTGVPGETDPDADEVNDVM